MAHNWFGHIGEITPYIFKIETPDGFGTGFQIFYSPVKKFCGVVTAYHVIDDAYVWKKPIKIRHSDSKKEIFLEENQRAIIAYPESDLAFILFGANDLPIKHNDLKLGDPKKILKQGVHVAWLGFPQIANANELCFFAGHISYVRTKEHSYLVDGVAINGVSGGPVFAISSGGKACVYGVVTEYRVNRIVGESRPGLSFVRSIEPFHKDLQAFRSLDEAKKKERKEEKNSLPSDAENK